jgi:hypothetical protein
VFVASKVLYPSRDDCVRVLLRSGRIKIRRATEVRMFAILAFRSTRGSLRECGVGISSFLGDAKFSAALGFPNSADEIRFFNLGDLAKAYGAIAQNWSVLCAIYAL